MVSLSSRSSEALLMSLVGRYYELVDEWQTGRPVDRCERGNWERNYTRLHAEVGLSMRRSELKLISPTSR